MNSRSTSSGRASPQRALLFGLFGVVTLASIVAWLVLHGHGEVDSTTAPGVATKRHEETPPPTVTPAPPSEPKIVDEDAFNKGMKSLAQVPVKNGGPRNVVDAPTFPLEGRVVNDRDDTPVYFFDLYLIPTDQGDPLVAMKTWNRNRFTKGEFRLDRQPGGAYHLVVESRECDPVVKTVQVPYEGKLQVRLKNSTTLRGVVRDTNSTPLPNLAVQIVIGALDPQPDGSETLPPIQRRTTTDGMGNYAFYKLPSGSYGVQVLVNDDVLVEEKSFRVDRSAEVDKSFSIAQFGNLRIVAKNIADQPLAKARATLWRTDGDGRRRIVRSAESDLKGIARLDFVREGSYKLEVSMAGFEVFEQPISVAGNEGYRELPVLLKVDEKSARR